jgi:hypothetical protein
MSLILKAFPPDSILARDRLIERNQQVGANSRKPLSPSFVAIFFTLASISRDLRDIFVTASLL